MEAGVTLSRIIETTESLGLFYPPDPTEKTAFIGGTIATNASGARTFRYGQTREYITEIDVVLPSGYLLNIKRGEIFAENYILEFNADKNIDLSYQIINYQI